MLRLLPGFTRTERLAARVVVVGANFAGLSLALRLPRRYHVTVVDAAPRFEFLPNIHELVSGLKAPADLQLALAPLLRRAGHTFLHDRVVEIDRVGRTICTSQGLLLDFDVLAVAVGGMGATHGVKGAEEHALPFRTVADCAAIGARLSALARTAGRDRPAVVIVGGGLEGVEALGEILRAYRDRLQVTLVESQSKLLPEVQVGLDREIVRRCARRPVRIITGRRVREVAAGQVTLADGEQLMADAVIWTGGLVPSPLLHQAGLAPGGRWAPVERTLQSIADHRVFVVGDAAALPSPLAKQAYHALDMGAHAARNIDRMLKGRPLEPFVPAEKPMLIAFGDLDSFLVTDSTALAGAALSAAKEAVYQLVMSRLDASQGLSTVVPLLHRSRKGLVDLAQANLGSLSAVRRSLDLRVVR